jgi:hypothetical protein
MSSPASNETVEAKVIVSDTVLVVDDKDFFACQEEVPPSVQTIRISTPDVSSTALWFFIFANLNIHSVELDGSLSVEDLQILNAKMAKLYPLAMGMKVSVNWILVFRRERAFMAKFCEKSLELQAQCQTMQIQFLDLFRDQPTTHNPEAIRVFEDEVSAMISELRELSFDMVECSYRNEAVVKNHEMNKKYRHELSNILVNLQLRKREGPCHCCGVSNRLQEEAKLDVSLFLGTRGRACLSYFFFEN